MLLRKPLYSKVQKLRWYLARSILKLHQVQSLSKVESAIDMFVAVKDKANEADIFISSAAVADYSATTIATDKIKKSSETLSLTLTKNPDILSEISHALPDLFTVGFAAETNNLESYAQGKLD